MNGCYGCGCPLLLPSQREMADYDARTIASGTHSIELMERAGRAVLELLLADPGLDCKAGLLILCGPGNNGGDGLVMARLARERGLACRTILVSSKSYSQDCSDRLAALRGAGGDVLLFPEAAEPELDALIAGAAVVVDALLGTGQREAPRGNVGRLAERVSARLASLERGPKLVAVDIPTGADGDTGALHTPHLAADLCVCIQAIKRGLVQEPARSACGRVQCVDIAIRCEPAPEIALVDRDALPDLLSRPAAAHKGCFGHVLVIGGCSEMPGAPCLAAAAAVESGAGLVTMAKSWQGFHPYLPPEVMLAACSSESGALEEGHLAALEPYIERANALLIGPGLGRRSATAGLLSALLGRLGSSKPAVIDADALQLLASERKTSPLRLEGCVLTPHPGEMGTLLGCSIPEVQADRYSAARRLAEESGAVVVLKGHASIVHTGKRGTVNTTGNPFMASGGSGDVLSGMIAACLAQGLPAFDAAALAVYAHGRAGDLAHAESGSFFGASKLVNFIPKAYAHPARE